MYGYIYRLTNKLNNKSYIGKHKYNKPELDKSYITSGVIIKESISKYGMENFIQEIIDTADTLEDLNTKEIYYISYFNTLVPNGYNLTKGGDGLTEPSAQVREVMSKKKLGTKQSDETKRKRVASLKKVVHPKEWVDKIREANVGQKPTEYSRRRSSETHLGTCWYNNGVIEKMLFENNVPEGFVRGRLKKSR